MADPERSRERSYRAKVANRLICFHDGRRYGNYFALASELTYSPL